MRGGGNEADEDKEDEPELNEEEEGHEEEHEFEEDAEIVNVEDENEQYEAQTPASKMNKRMSFETDAEPEPMDAAKTPDEKISRKRSFESAASPGSVGTPGSVASGTSASSKMSKQSHLMSFFTPTKGLLKDEPADEPPLPPRRKALRVEDAVAAMIRSGDIVVDGRKVSMDETPAVREISTQLREKLGGRPRKFSKLRGVAGGHKSNVRKKGERMLRQDLPISFKHQLCVEIQEERSHHPALKDVFSKMRKKYNMTAKRVRKIWEKRMQWKADVQKYKQSKAEDMRPKHKGMAQGSHAAGSGHMRVRASGAGAKLDFPECYEKVKVWVNAERMHGHTVLPRHIAWKYQEYLQNEKLKLEDQLSQESDKGAKHQLKIKLDKADKQLTTLKNQKAQDKRAKHLMDWMGAKVRKPNLRTQISEVEQQVRAELTWQQHDYLIWQIARKNEDTYKDMFAQPDQAKAKAHQCVLGFSDQIPLWVKKPSEREVFAEFETTSRKAAKTSKVEVSGTLSALAKRKKLASGVPAQPLDDAEKTADQQGVEDAQARSGEDAAESRQLVPADEGQEVGEADVEEDEYFLHQPSMGDQMAKNHLTALKESNVDKYRITFEAHQLVSGFFAKLDDEGSEKPVRGHVLAGVLVVPGPHASLENISAADEWIEAEEYEYQGQMRRHEKGRKVGRVLEPWRRLRREHGEVMRHFLVMSQPAAMMDGVIMAWQIRDMAKKYPMSLWQRDCFAAAFTSEVRAMQFMSHQVSASVMAKMTSALQLTDTDFSHRFKSKVRNGVDEKMTKGQSEIRKDEVGPSEQYKLSTYDLAQILDKAMEEMIQANESEQWVLKGLRRNGMLALRPEKGGVMRFQDEKVDGWCKGMSLGSSKISNIWLKNRLGWISEEGKKVEAPNFERIEGAKELSDLLEWSYENDASQRAAAIDLAGSAEPDWVAAGNFQLPLDLRRQLALKEQGMSAQDQERREKMREKRLARTERNKAKNKMSADEKEQVRSSLMSSSRFEAMSKIVPKASAKRKAAAKTKVLSAKQKALKNQAKLHLKKAQAAFLKKKEAEQVNEEKGLPPLPPPAEAPEDEVQTDEVKAVEDAAPASAHAIAEKNLKMRIIRDQAGMTLYGRQGLVMSQQNEKTQLLLEADTRHKKDQLAWIRSDLLIRVNTDMWTKSDWVWPQLTMSRQVKQWFLLEAGIIGSDVDEKAEWDYVDTEVSSALDGQTIWLGWLLMRYFISNKSLKELDEISLVHPALVQPFIVSVDQQAAFNMPECEIGLKDELSKDKKMFLFPISGGFHWVLLAFDKSNGILRFYDSGVGSDEEKDLGTELEIKNLNEVTLAKAEKLLGELLRLGCIDQQLLEHSPPLRRYNEKVRQPKGSNMCGHFVLAFAEELALDVIGYGPAANGWAHVSAFAWKNRNLPCLDKLSQPP